MSNASTEASTDEVQVVTGTVTRFVTSHGANWGLITVDGTTRKAFFNRASFVNVEELAQLRLGEKVRFEELSDPVNGTHAVNVMSNRSASEDGA